MAADARVAWAVALVLAVGLGAVSVFLVPLAFAERDRGQVREVAGAMAARVTTFSSDDLDAWADGVKGLATAEYAEEVDRLLGDVLGGEGAGGDGQPAGVVSRGQVTGLYVQALDAARAEVFAVVRQTVTGEASEGAAASTVRMTMELSRTGGQWRVSAVSVLSGRA